jgi:hypothetical protein
MWKWYELYPVFWKPGVCLQGKGLKFVMSGSNDAVRELIKSIFVDIVEQFMEYLSWYAFSCLCSDSCAWQLGYWEDGCGVDLRSMH